ncbi:MAG: M12 family metallo-peptidase, partial [Candidatus Zixiibacteriota bacterium]
MNKPTNLSFGLGLLVALCFKVAILTVAASPVLGATQSGRAIDTLKLFSEVRESTERHELQATLEPGAFDRSKAGPAVQAIALPVEANKTLILELERFNVLAPDARFYMGGPPGNTPIDLPDVVLMRGKVADDPKSFAFFAISPSGMVNGFVDRESGNDYVFATLREDLAARNNTVTVRQTPAFDPLDIPFCGTKYDPDLIPRPDKSVRTPISAAGPLLQRVAIDADQKFVQMFGSVVEAQDYIVQLMGAVSAIYERDNNIRMTLAVARLWPSGGEPFEPYDLYGFREHWWNNEDTTGLNLVHMFSGARDAPYGGVAYYSSTCDGGAFGIDAYMNGSFLAPVTYPDNGNWDINLVAHEMGHNHGAPHTHNDYFSPHIDDCGNGTYSRGTIMSYCHTTQGYQRNIDLRFHRR